MGQTANGVIELAQLEASIAAGVDVRKQAADLAARLANAMTDGAAAAQLHITASRHYEESGRLVDAGQQLRNAGHAFCEANKKGDAVDVLERAVKLLDSGGNALLAARTAEEAGDLVANEGVALSRRARLYMAAKNAYGNVGMYDESARAYLKEMRSRLHLAVWRLFDTTEKVTLRGRSDRLGKAIRYALWDITCLYGESLPRLLLVGATVVLGFAAVYWRWNGLAEVDTFWDAAQYSLSTFSTFTVGKFMLHDSPGWNALAVCEALFGAAWQALLLSVLLRQLSRR